MLTQETPPLPYQKNGTWSEFWSSLNFLLCIIGYPLSMALLTPFSSAIDVGENIYFTYPYRFFQMLIATIALIAVRKNPLPQPSCKIFLLMIFWAFFLARALWNLFVDIPLTAQGNIWYYRFYLIIDTFPLLAVAKGWNKINFKKSLPWIIVLGSIGLAFSAQSISFQIEASWTGEIGRAAASRMLHTQALGYLSATIILISTYMVFVEKKRSVFWKILSTFTILLGFYTMLKAGSRGPLLAIVFTVSLWVGVRRKNFLAVVLMSALCVALIFLFQDQLISVIRDISPTMAERTLATTQGGDTSGRDVLWSNCWEECKKNPLFGYGYTAFGYPHNMFLDGLMMFGMFGGWIITILILLALSSALKFLHRSSTDYWWILLLLAALSQAWTQSGFSAPGIQAPLTLLFIFEAVKEHYRRHQFPSIQNASNL